MEKEKYQKGIAKIMRDTRQRRGLSVSVISEMLDIDDKTWSRYETGATSPSGAELLRIFAVLGEHILPQILRLIYPTIYAPTTDTKEIRNAASHFFTHIASDQYVREWEFLMFGNHGSNIEPQMQMFTMIDHMPLQYRVVVAQLVLSLWRMAEARGELVGLEFVSPDLEVFCEGLRKGEQAVWQGLDSYTSI